MSDQETMRDLLTRLEETGVADLLVNVMADVEADRLRKESADTGMEIDEKDRAEAVSDEAEFVAHYLTTYIGRRASFRDELFKHGFVQKGGSWQHETGWKWRAKFTTPELYRFDKGVVQRVRIQEGDFDKQITDILAGKYDLTQDEMIDRNFAAKRNVTIVARKCGIEADAAKLLVFLREYNVWPETVAGLDLPKMAGNAPSQQERD